MQPTAPPAESFPAPPSYHAQQQVDYGQVQYVPQPVAVAVPAVQVQYQAPPPQQPATGILDVSICCCHIIYIPAHQLALESVLTYCYKT